MKEKDTQLKKPLLKIKWKSIINEESIYANEIPIIYIKLQSNLRKQLYNRLQRNNSLLTLLGIKLLPKTNPKTASVEFNLPLEFQCVETPETLKKEFFLFLDIFDNLELTQTTLFINTLAAEFSKYPDKKIFEIELTCKIDKVIKILAGDDTASETYTTSDGTVLKLSRADKKISITLPETKTTEDARHEFSKALLYRLASYLTQPQQTQTSYKKQPNVRSHLTKKARPLEAEKLQAILNDWGNRDGIVIDFSAYPDFKDYDFNESSQTALGNFIQNKLIQKQPDQVTLNLNGLKPVTIRQILAAIDKIDIGNIGGHKKPKIVLQDFTIENFAFLSDTKIKLPQNTELQISGQSIKYYETSKRFELNPENSTKAVCELLNQFKVDVIFLNQLTVTAWEEVEKYLNLKKFKSVALIGGKSDFIERFFSTDFLTTQTILISHISTQSAEAIFLTKSKFRTLAIGLMKADAARILCEQAKNATNIEQLSLTNHSPAETYAIVNNEKIATLRFAKMRLANAVALAKAAPHKKLDSLDLQNVSAAALQHLIIESGYSIDRLIIRGIDESENMDATKLFKTLRVLEELDIDGASFEFIMKVARHMQADIKLLKLSNISGLNLDELKAHLKSFFHGQLVIDGKEQVLPRPRRLKRSNDASETNRPFKYLKTGFWQQYEAELQNLAEEVERIQTKKP